LPKDMQSHLSIPRIIQSPTIDVHSTNNTPVNRENNLFSVIFSKSWIIHIFF